MHLRIFPRPSGLCKGCELYNENCHCMCHDYPMFSGLHEISWQLPFDPTKIEENYNYEKGDTLPDEYYKAYGQVRPSEDESS